MSRSHQIAINAITQWAVTGISAALGLLVVPFLIAKLGQNGFGLVALIFAIASLCALADLGVAGALARQLSESLTRHDLLAFNEYASTAAAANLVVGVLCALAVFGFAGPLAGVFSLPPDLIADGVKLLRTFGVGYVGLTFLTFVPRAVLASHNRFDRSCFVEAFRRLAQTVGLLLVLTLTSLGLVGWATVCIAVEVASTALLWRAAFHTRNDLQISLNLFRLARLKGLYGLGSQLTLLQISGQLSVAADPFILSACLGPAALSLYRPPSQAIGAVLPVALTLANQLHPIATNAHVSGDGAALADVLLRGTKYTVFIGALACAILIPLADPLCRLWLGGVLGEQYKVCSTVLIIEAATLLGATSAGTQWPLLLGMKRTAFAAYGRLTLAIVNIIASWLLVRHSALGVVAVVIPTMVIEVVWRPVLMWYTCRAAGISVRKYVRQSYVSPFLIASGIAAVGYTIQRVSALDNPWSLSSAAIIMAALGAISIWTMGFSSMERKNMSNVIRSFAVHKCV